MSSRGGGGYAPSAPPRSVPAPTPGRVIGNAKGLMPLKPKLLKDSRNQIGISRGTRGSNQKVHYGRAMDFFPATACKFSGIHSKSLLTTLVNVFDLVKHVFISKGCDVRVLEKSPGEYYTRDEIEQVKFHFTIFLFSA